MQRVLFIAFFGSFAILCSSISSAAVVSTASYKATTPADAILAAIVELHGVPSSPLVRRLAQTFLAGTEGALQTISVTAGARSGVPVPDASGLSVAIATVVGGQPSVILGSAPIQNVEVLPSISGPFSAPTVQQAVADFASQGITLEAGSTYAMIFSTDTFGDSFFILGGQTGYPNGAMGGNQPTGGFGFSPIADIFFDVKVDAIPEPTTLALVAMLAGGASMRRKLD